MSEIQIAIPARDGLLQVSGPDAARFLQGQLSNDIHVVDAKRGQLSSLCSPRGRVLAVLRVYALPDGYLLAMPHAILADILARLQRYVLRSKVTLADVTLEYKHLGVWGSGAPARLQDLDLLPEAGHFTTAIRDEQLAMRLPGATERFELWTPATRFAAFVRENFEACEPLGIDRWQALDIAAGLATLSPATQDRFVAQSLGLDALGAINFRKGCYTGQEIIARLHYLGKPKHALYCARLETATAPAPATPIHAQGQEAAAGHVVNSANLDGVVELLAVLPNAARADYAVELEGNRFSLRETTALFPPFDE